MRGVHTTGLHPFAMEHCYECAEITLHKNDRCVHCGRPHSAPLPRLERNPHHKVQPTIERKRA